MKSTQSDHTNLAFTAFVNICFVYNPQCLAAKTPAPEIRSCHLACYRVAANMSEFLLKEAQDPALGEPAGLEDALEFSYDILEALERHLGLECEIFELPEAA